MADPKAKISTISMSRESAMIAPTTIPTPRPPPSQPTVTTHPKAPEPGASPKKRKLEEVGFQYSPYYNIRSAVANFRGHFLQVYHGTDTQKKDASLEILKEIKILSELSKKMRLDLSAAAGLVKPTDQCAAGDAINMPEGKIPSGEKNQVPPTDKAALFMHSAGEKVPLNPVTSWIAAERPSVSGEIKREAVPIQMSDCTKQPSQSMQGSYVIGGSPIGWNFLMWPGSKAIYYGLTKPEWFARQAAKMKCRSPTPQQSS